MQRCFPGLILSGQTGGITGCIMHSFLPSIKKNEREGKGKTRETVSHITYTVDPAKIEIFCVVVSCANFCSIGTVFAVRFRNYRHPQKKKEHPNNLRFR